MLAWIMYLLFKKGFGQKRTAASFASTRTRSRFRASVADLLNTPTLPTALPKQTQWFDEIPLSAETFLLIFMYLPNRDAVKILRIWYFMFNSANHGSYRLLGHSMNHRFLKIHTVLLNSLLCSRKLKPFTPYP